MELQPFEAPPSVLVISAHPDDVDFGLAGTVARWTAAGTEVAYCIVTDGNVGGFDPSIPRSDIPAIRRREQRAAAKVVGVETVEFLGYVDGEVTVTLGLRRDLAAVIRRFRPHTVVAQSPVRNFARIGASHPDHMAVGEAALCAVYPDARNPFTFVELAEAGLEAHTVSQVALMAYPEPTHFVDVSETLDAKLEAISCHASQLPDPEATRTFVRGWLRQGAEAAGLGDDRYAELFFVFPTA